MNGNILEIRNLSKKYPGVQALQDVSLAIQRNTVHCIVGENGAGKSTFIKILTRAEERTGGSILFKGQEFRPRSIREAMNLGISTLFQELNVVDQLTVEQNLLLGREDTLLGVIRRPERSGRLYQVLKDFAPDIPLNRKVGELAYAEKQIIEIVKAVAAEASLLIMDEPTAALSEKEAGRLFELIRGLKRQDITVIYISHILDDIFAIGDFVTVFRDGSIIGSQRVADIVGALRAQPGAILVAAGDEALAGALASAIEPPRLAILDVRGFDRSRDEDFLAHLYIPGLRRAGDLQTASEMAPSRLVIHNAGSQFAATGARVQHAALTSTEILALVRESSTGRGR